MIGARGEVSLQVGDVEYRLCLTLGALAEIETAFGCTNMSELQVRLKRLSAGELSKLLLILMRGGGAACEEAVLEKVTPGAAARAVAEAFHAALG